MFATESRNFSATFREKKLFFSLAYFREFIRRTIFISFESLTENVCRKVACWQLSDTRDIIYTGKLLLLTFCVLSSVLSSLMVNRFLIHNEIVWILPYGYGIRLHKGQLVTFVLRLNREFYCFKQKYQNKLWWSSLYYNVEYKVTLNYLLVIRVIPARVWRFYQNHEMRWI